MDGERARRDGRAKVDHRMQPVGQCNQLVTRLWTDFQRQRAFGHGGKHQLHCRACRTQGPRAIQSQRGTGGP